MTVLRYLTPPIFGATASLGLLYLYQQSLVTTHSNLRDSIVSGSQAVKRIEDRHQGLIEDKVRETREQIEGQVRGGRSRYSQGGESISDEIRRKWNSNILAVTSYLSHLEPDSVILKTLYSLSIFSSSAVSSLTGSSPDASLSEKLGQVKDDLGREISLRTPEEVKRKYEEVKSAAKTEARSTSLR